MTDKAYGFLGIMTKAGKIETGETKTGDACRTKKAVLLLLAKDASDNAAKRAAEFSAMGDVPVLTLPYEKDALSSMTAGKIWAMAAVTDLGMADAFVNKISQAGINTKNVEERLKERLQKKTAEHLGRNKGTRGKNKSIIRED